MKKFLLSAVCIVAIAASGLAGYAHYQQSQIDPAILENIEALSDPEGGGMDCIYIVNEDKCEVKVGANGKIKVFGVGTLYAGADGTISFDGKVTCTADGNTSCVHVTCKELYEVIF